MDHEDANRRRNIFGIITEIGFLDRKSPEPTEATPSLAPPNLEGPHADLARTLLDAQARAADRRLAAERLLHEALELERQLADDAAQVQAANEQALGLEIAQALEKTRAAEQEAAARAGVCDQSVERLAGEKAQAEALQADHRTAYRIASDELAEARRRFEAAEAASSESDRRFAEASAAEEAARAEATTASQFLAALGAACEEMEQRLREIQQRTAGSTVGLPSLETVQRLRALEERTVVVPTERMLTAAERHAAEAAQRIEQRRAADALRAVTS